MKRAIMFAAASALCFAETWSGKLIDPACKDKAQQSGQTMDCSATASTRTFGIELSDGTVLKLDSDGNAKAAEVVKTNKSPNVQVTVTGSLDGKGGVKVESLNIQGQ
jgi:hypothetical protein